MQTQKYRAGEDIYGFPDTIDIRVTSSSGASGATTLSKGESVAWKFNAIYWDSSYDGERVKSASRKASSEAFTYTLYVNGIQVDQVKTKQPSFSTVVSTIKTGVRPAEWVDY